MVFLTNLDLERAAQKYHIPLISVFSKNEIPTRIVKGGYIINLENSMDSAGNRLGGSHWVALWIDKAVPKHPMGYSCYFDPFGIPPPVEIQKLLNKFIPYDVNRTEIQSITSGICGYYCIYFLWYMSRNPKISPPARFKNFINLFNDKNPRKNGGILKELLEKTQ